MKKAVVFDNSGTLLERYRVIKEVSTGVLSSDVSSLDIIETKDSFALVVLQFNTNCLLDLDGNTLLSDVIKNYNIDFDISFSNTYISKESLKQLLYNEKTTTIQDITDGFSLLHKKIPNFELCNGSAVIIDVDLKKIIYTITSAGKLFKNVLSTIETLKNRNIEIFIASGDRKGAINKLASILDINENHAFGTVSTKQKSEIVKTLKSKGFKVMMVGDGLNDVLAFSEADISVLTIEQEEEVSPKLINTTDYIIKDIYEVTSIDF